MRRACCAGLGPARLTGLRRKCDLGHKLSGSQSRPPDAWLGSPLCKMEGVILQRPRTRPARVCHLTRRFQLTSSGSRWPDLGSFARGDVGRGTGGPRGSCRPTSPAPLCLHVGLTFRGPGTVFSPGAEWPACVPGACLIASTSDGGGNTGRRPGRGARTLRSRTTPRSGTGPRDVHADAS